MEARSTMSKIKGVSSMKQEEELKSARTRAPEKGHMWCWHWCVVTLSAPHLDDQGLPKLALPNSNRLHLKAGRREDGWQNSDGVCACVRYVV